MDPHKPSVLNLTDEEIEWAEGQMEQGLLPKDWLLRCDLARRANVFGVDYKEDRHGNPIEQGKGSASQMTANSIESYKRYCANEPDFERHLARMQKLLAEQQQAQRNEKARPGRR
jgi:hypothetical protein